MVWISVNNGIGKMVKMNIILVVTRKEKALEVI